MKINHYGLCIHINNFKKINLISVNRPEAFLYKYSFTINSLVFMRFFFEFCFKNWYAGSVRGETETIERIFPRNEIYLFTTTVCSNVGVL